MRARGKVVLLFVCLAAALVLALEPGVIVLTVTDSGGAAIPGVPVTIAGPVQRTGVTDERGECRFIGVPPGTYDITAELPGFTTSADRVTLHDGETRRLTTVLRVAALEETVTVASSSPVIDVQSTARPTPPAVALPSPPAPMAVGGGVRGTPAYGYGSPYEYEPSYRHNRPNTESYTDAGENPFRSVSAEPLSTFSIDVDTASYANVRRFLTDGQWPPAEAVRIEELINYFHYPYPQPTGDQPFSITTELAACPWNEKHRLALIGLQGKGIDDTEVPARNLVFLIDVSGSMMSPDKLPLVRYGLRMLAATMRPDDRVAIVVYAGNSGVVLPSTAGDQKERIDRAIAGLEAGGSTNGGAGIRLAYQIARDHFIKDGVNRVILATDGDFNVGVVDQGELTRLIERERTSGVFLSVLGVGTGNLKDSTMEMLADKGNGNYSYLDSMHEAHRVLVKEAGSTLVTIAKDVKIQIEFNPQNVSAYRLIGYENRMLKREDFNDDRKDAGEIGAGHSVTAIYEIVPPGTEIDRPAVDRLKYGASAATPSAAAASKGKYDEELMTVKLRYKAPDGDASRLTSIVIADHPQTIGANLGFASAVAEAGMVLRESAYARGNSGNTAIARARKFRGDDVEGYRAEFIRLMELAASLPKRDRTYQ